jgi:HTH-type transcriptional regulator / antitoxin MqsA
MSQPVTCHECGSVMVRDTRPMTFTYKGKSVEIDQPGLYCSGCGESLLSIEDAQATEAAFLAFKADVDGILPAEEIVRIRKKLKLSQTKAGTLLGGGPRAFQKYESHKDTPAKAMSNLLRLLDNDPSRLTELEGPTGGREKTLAPE